MLTRSPRHPRRRRQRLDHRPQHLPAAARGGADSCSTNHRASTRARPERHRSEATRCRLYLITPPALMPARSPTCSRPRRSMPATSAALQLRLKDAADGQDPPRDRGAAAGGPGARRRRSPERPRRPGGGDGLRRRPSRPARRRPCRGADAARPDRILGITCHDSRHLAMKAGELGADYVAFGAFFPTATKAAQHRADIETAGNGGRTSSPCPPWRSAASPRRIAPPLVAAGADFLAVVGAVWNHPEGPAAGRAGDERGHRGASADGTLEVRATADVFTDTASAATRSPWSMAARALDGAAMQRLAREFNLSETVFVLPPRRRGADARIRIFTPGAELALRRPPECRHGGAAGPAAGHRR